MNTNIAFLIPGENGAFKGELTNGQKSIAFVDVGNGVDLILTPFDAARIDKMTKNYIKLTQTKRDDGIYKPNAHPWHLIDGENSTIWINPKYITKIDIDSSSKAAVAFFVRGVDVFAYRDLWFYWMRDSLLRQKGRIKTIVRNLEALFFPFDFIVNNGLVDRCSAAIKRRLLEHKTVYEQMSWYIKNMLTDKYGE